MTVSHYDRIGGEQGLQQIIAEFVDRLFADPMIGFFFRDITKERLCKFEFQHAAEHLGGPVRYQGRPLREAHSKHRIMGGQFDRRKQILANVLTEFQVPVDVSEAWLAHVESLRPLITSDAAGMCR